jgi:hypothetical protein
VTSRTVTVDPANSSPGSSQPHDLFDEAHDRTLSMNRKIFLAWSFQMKIAKRTTKLSRCETGTGNRGFCDEARLGLRSSTSQSCWSVVDDWLHPTRKTQLQRHSSHTVLTARTLALLCYTFTVQQVAIVSINSTCLLKCRCFKHSVSLARFFGRTT